jgi:hypothetical protein
MYEDMPMSKLVFLAGHSSEAMMELERRTAHVHGVNCEACSAVVDTPEAADGWAHRNRDGSLICGACYSRWQTRPVEVEWVR